MDTGSLGIRTRHISEKLPARSWPGDGMRRKLISIGRCLAGARGSHSLLSVACSPLSPGRPIHAELLGKLQRHIHTNNYMRRRYISTEAKRAQYVNVCIYVCDVRRGPLVVCVGVGVGVWVCACACVCRCVCVCSLRHRSPQVEAKRQQVNIIIASFLRVSDLLGRSPFASRREIEVDICLILTSVTRLVLLACLLPPFWLFATRAEM